MTKLNQIVAVEKDVKSTTHRELTNAYQQLQKGDLLNGFTRSYKPKDDEGDQLPSETKRVQYTVGDALNAVQTSLTRLFDITATKDFANTTAKADVVVDGVTIVEGAPVPYLLFLEKQLEDVATVVAKLPVLDSAEDWEYDNNTGLNKTTPVVTTRSKKIPRNHVLAEATDRHPAQVQVWHEDVNVGSWETVKFSGAIPATERAGYLAKVRNLIKAVKFAREQANSTTVTDVKVGDRIFGYLFG